MRKLAAIMFTDIAGYTALMSHDEEKALRLLQQNRALLKPIIEQFRGEWLKEIGDGTLSSFASAVDAVNCALVIQRTLKDDPEFSLRVGIHIGDVVFERGDVFGDGVNVASRIEPLAEPGCICVSEQVYDAIRNKPGIEATFFGEKRLKGVDRPVKVYAITEQRGVLKEPETVPDKPGKPRWMVWAAVGAVAVAVAVAVVVLLSLLHGPGQEAALGAKSIAVLPFVNFSDSKEDEYFSDGITDDILTHLCKVGDLNVIARTSSMQYKGTDKRPREIAQELGVATILEGSVRRYGNKVRIVSQLIDARTEKHLWAEEYDRDLTDIFAIQSDVAQKIAAALKATLTPGEKDYIEQKPTENLKAYEYYIKGKALYEQARQRGTSIELFENAIFMYEKAVELDPTFAMAYARLTFVHLTGFVPTEERIAKAKRSLDRALALDPDHPEVHWAYGYYYYEGFKDYARAQEHFSLALQNQPNNSDFLWAIGQVQRNQGQWEAAAASMRKAAELDPRYYSKSADAVLTYLPMRNWAEAEHFADRCIFISPGTARSYTRKASVYLRSKGDIEKAREVMQEALEIVSPDKLIDFRSYIEILSRDYQKAWDIVEADTVDWFLRFFRKAEIYKYMDLPEQATAYYDSARITYEEQVRKVSDDHAAHDYLGIAYAGLGRREDAIREGKLAVEIMPLSRDAVWGYRRILNLAIIYTMLGEQYAAIAQLEVLLSIPSDLTVPLLRLDPQWDPLREHPRFQELVAGD